MRIAYKILFGISVIAVVLSIVSLANYGLRFGVDFKGGSAFEFIANGTRPTVVEIVDTLNTSSVDKVHDAAVAPTGDRGIIIKTAELNETEHQQVLTQLREAFPQAQLQEQKFDAVGPVIGNELRHKSIVAVIVVLIAICIYIAIMFRMMSGVLSPWVMGLAAIVALLHDVIIPVGVFAWLGHTRGVEISAVFVAAVLTILGYSISDTVVIFDRVRENVIRLGARTAFPEVVHVSVMQTLARSLNTSITTLLALVAIYLFGGESVHYFALALIIGVALGAFSSISIASPLLVWWSRLGRRKA